MWRSTASRSTPCATFEIGAQQAAQPALRVLHVPDALDQLFEQVVELEAGDLYERNIRSGCLLIRRIVHFPRRPRRASPLAVSLIRAAEGRSPHLAPR